jgi:hypothetical protein
MNMRVERVLHYVMLPPCLGLRVVVPRCAGRVATYRPVQHNYCSGGADNYRTGAGDNPASSWGAKSPRDFCSVVTASCNLPTSAGTSRSPHIGLQTAPP